MDLDGRRAEICRVLLDRFPELAESAVYGVCCLGCRIVQRKYLLIAEIDKFRKRRSRFKRDARDFHQHRHNRSKRNVQQPCLVDRQLEYSAQSFAKRFNERLELGKDILQRIPERRNLLRQIARQDILENILVLLHVQKKRIGDFLDFEQPFLRFFKNAETDVSERLPEIVLDVR